MQKKPIAREELTSATFEPDELWEVKAQNKTYRLSGKQAQALKELTNSGSRGLVWFKNFAISIPHITSVEKIKNSAHKRLEASKELAKQFGFDRK